MLNIDYWNGNYSKSIHTVLSHYPKTTPSSTLHFCSLKNYRIRSNAQTKLIFLKNNLEKPSHSHSISRNRHIDNLSWPVFVISPESGHYILDLID